jgi:hypothetical protein
MHFCSEVFPIANGELTAPRSSTNPSTIRLFHLQSRGEKSFPRQTYTLETRRCGKAKLHGRRASQTSDFESGVAISRRHDLLALEIYAAKSCHPSKAHFLFLFLKDEGVSAALV